MVPRRGGHRVPPGGRSCSPGLHHGAREPQSPPTHIHGTERGSELGARRAPPRVRLQSHRPGTTLGDRHRHWPDAAGDDAGSSPAAGLVPAPGPGALVDPLRTGGNAAMHLRNLLIPLLGLALASAACGKAKPKVAPAPDTGAPAPSPPPARPPAPPPTDR